MDYDKYILVDYENAQGINIDIIDEKAKIVIVMGGNKNKISADLIQRTQPFGNSIEYLQIKNNRNKNILCFFIVYFLGQYIFSQGNKEYIIYSKNKAYDPLIDYLHNKNINVKRIANFRQTGENRKDIFYKNPFGYILSLWRRLTIIRKISFGCIILAVIGSLAALRTIPLRHTPVPVINSPIRREAELDRIVRRISQENVKASVTPDGIVRVADEATALRMRAILIREDLIPAGTDPWAVFVRERWTVTDFERNANLRENIRQMVTDQIEAMDDVDQADVFIVLPEHELFRSEQNPITANVVIVPKPGSDITGNRQKIEGIQKILKLAVDGLDDKNIVIVNHHGVILNDFE
jgi:hypothetical protein